MFLNFKKYDCLFYSNFLSLKEACTCYERISNENRSAKYIEIVKL